MMDFPPELLKYVALFTKESHITFGNTPRGLAEAYQEAVRARVFLEAGGFLTWFLYFLTNRAVKSTTHFDGQAADQHLLNTFDTCSPEDQLLVAQQLSRSISAPNLQKFQDVFEKTIKPNQRNNLMVAPQKRRRTTDHTDPTPTSLLSPTTSAAPQKRRRTTDHTDPTPTSLLSPTTAAASQTRRHTTDHIDPAPTSLLSPTTSANTLSTSTESQQNSNRFIVGNPPILKVTPVLPPYLAGAIQRYEGVGNPWLAAITMSFFDASSFGNKLGSMMSLRIKGNKVERLANMLFDASVESTDEHRYLLMPNNLRAIPTSDFVLRGCNRDVIAEVFGKNIANAIKSSPAFKEEAEQGELLTECVSMTISCRVDEGAVINLSLDEKEGYRVKAKLYD